MHDHGVHRAQHVLLLVMALIVLPACSVTPPVSPNPGVPTVTPLVPGSHAAPTATPFLPPNLGATGGPALLEPPARLARDCERRAFSTRPMVPGQPAVDFTLKDTQGREYTLSQLLAHKPVVMIFGSFTCPPFRQQCAANEELYRKYGAFVHVLTVYTKETHPFDQNPARFSRDAQGTPVTQPHTYRHRLALALKTIKEATLTMPVLVDEMDNPLWCTYGRLPNGAFLIGMDGRIVVRQDWNDARRLEQAIKEYLGTW